MLSTLQKSSELNQSTDIDLIDDVFVVLERICYHTHYNVAISYAILLLK